MLMLKSTIGKSGYCSL